MYKAVNWGTIFITRKTEQNHVFINSKLMKSAMNASTPQPCNSQKEWHNPIFSAWKMPATYYVKTKTNSKHKWQKSMCHDSIWENIASLSVYKVHTIVTT